MIKNELYNKLTELQKQIINRALEGNKIEDSNAKDIMMNIRLEEIDDIITSENARSTTFEVYEDIYRYINSQLEDLDIRKEKLIVSINKEYKKAQEYIDKSMFEENINHEDIFKDALVYEDDIIKSMGIEFGFSDSEILKIACLQLDFHGIDNIQL